MKKESVVDIRDTESEEALKKNRRTDTIIRILSLIGAILIWVYVVLSDTAIYNYQNVSVTIKAETMVKTKGYTVEYESMKVNFTVQGNAAKISQLSNNSVEVYADLSAVNLTEITDGQPVSLQLPIVYKLPTDVSGISITQKSQEYIDVIITEKSPNN